MFRFPSARGAVVALAVVCAAPHGTAQDDTSVDELVQLLRAADATVMHSALDQLEAAGAAAVPVLLEAVGNGYSQAALDAYLAVAQPDERAEQLAGVARKQHNDRLTIKGLTRLVDTDPAALRSFERHAFERYGLESGGLRVDAETHDQAFLRRAVSPSD